MLYDTCCGCDWPWLKARIGTDALLGNWLFFIACFGAGCYGFIYVLFQPASAMAWTMFAFAANMALGSYLYLRAFDPETAGGSLFFGDSIEACKSPLIHYGATWHNLTLLNLSCACFDLGHLTAERRSAGRVCWMSTSKPTRIRNPSFAARLSPRAC